MSKADDVNTLFRRFGGDASTYQEVGAEQQVDSAMARWPMLDQISPRIRPHVPAGVAANPAGLTRTHHAVPEGISVAPVAVPSALAEAVVRHSVPLVPVVDPAPVVQVAAAPALPIVPVEVPAEPVAQRQPEVQLLGQVSPAPLQPEGTAMHEAAPSDLKAMFQSMLPKKVESASQSPAPALKRLAKW